MKAVLALGLVLFAAASAQAAAGPRIMIQASALDTVDPRRGEGIASSFMNIAAEQIAKEFPCATTITTSDLSALLGHLRMRMLVGGTEEQEKATQAALDAFAGSYGADYLVVLKVTADASRCVLSARWLDVRQAKALVNEMDSAAIGSGVLNAIDRLSAKLVDEAAYFEICPYKGPVKITVNTNRSKEEKEEYPVFCNGSDQQYVKTTSQSTVADTELQITRTRRNWAIGNIRYHSVETSKLVEEDPCHACDPQRKGVRIYTESHRTTVDIEGLSEESSTAGQQLSDARPYLKFDRNGSFRLEILATSKPGIRKVHIERKAEGTCDTTVAKPKEDYSMKTDIPLGNVMGPFPGRPRDKVLTGRNEFRQKNPVTGEETTINVEFELRRD